MPRFHDTIPDSCNPNLTDDQIAELVREGQESIARGEFIDLDSDDAIDAFVRTTMTQSAPILDKAS